MLLQEKYNAWQRRVDALIVQSPQVGVASDYACWVRWRLDLVHPLHMTSKTSADFLSALICGQ